MQYNIVLTALVIGSVVLAEIDDSPTGFPNLQNLQGSLPENIQIPGNLPINASQLPTLEEGEKIFKEKCKKMGREDAYEDAMRAKDYLVQCITGLVNVTELQAEMEIAKPTGDLDVVFKKYCRKSPKLTECIARFTEAIEPCLDDQEKENKHMIQNITDSLVKFICFKEGDRIALFIAEGGPKCLSSKQEDIQVCLNTTVQRNMPPKEQGFSLDNLPSLLLGEEQCREIDNLQTCVVTALEGCDEPTPANIVGSLFKFVHKMTPCAKLVTNGPRNNTAIAIHNSVGLSFLSISTVIVTHRYIFN